MVRDYLPQIHTSEGLKKRKRYSKKSGGIHRFKCTQNKYGAPKRYLKGPGGIIYRPHMKGYNKDGSPRKPSPGIGYPPTAKQLAWRQKFAETWGHGRKGRKGGFSGGLDEYRKAMGYAAGESLGFSSGAKKPSTKTYAPRATTSAPRRSKRTTDTSSTNLFGSFSSNKRPKGDWTDDADWGMQVD
jgi:hypothetical protein